MSWTVGLGSGRATCRVCNQKISKDLKQVTLISGAGGRRIYECVHLDCLIYYEKNQVLKALENGLPKESG